MEISEFSEINFMLTEMLPLKGTVPSPLRGGFTLTAFTRRVLFEQHDSKKASGNIFFLDNFVYY